MSDALITFSDGEQEYVVRKGLLFRAGDYPDKGFSLKPDELRAAAGRFSGAPIKDTHRGGSIFDGKLGTLAEVWANEDGTELHGAAYLPQWLDTLFADETIPMSTEWEHRAKNLAGLAAEPVPRVDNAGLMACFAAEWDRGTKDLVSVVLGPSSDVQLLAAFSADFASKRHSATDQGQVQAIHDAAQSLGAECGSGGTANMAGARHSGVDTELVQRVHDTAQALGAVCSPEKGTANMTATTITPQEQEQAVSLWQTIKTAFTGSDPANPPKVTPPAIASVATFAADVETPREKAMRLQLEEMQKERIEEKAAAFADGEVLAKRAYPSERATMMAMFSQAYADDQAHPALVFFGKDAEGKDRSGTRVENLRAMHAARPVHHLTEDMLSSEATITEEQYRVMFSGASAPTGDMTPTPEGKQPTESRIARLKGYAPSVN